MRAHPIFARTPPNTPGALIPWRLALGIPTLTLALLTALPLLALTLGASPQTVWRALVDPEVLAAIAVSLGCAAVATVLGILLAIPAGYLLARQRLPRSLGALFDLPLVVPHTIIGVGLLLAFSRKHLLGAALEETFGLRLVSAAPGVVVAMLVVSAPILVKGAQEAFRAVPLRLERTAQALGATPPRAFFTVVLPLGWPGLRSAALLAWARAVSEFGSIAVLAYYPRTAPVLIWDRFSAAGLEAAVAPALVLLGVCLAIFALVQWMTPAGESAP